MLNYLRRALEAGLRFSYLCVFSMCSAGCVPTFPTVFTPINPSAQVLDAQCPPEPRTVARFNQSGVFVSIRVRSGSSLSFDLAFEVPAGNVVEFKEETGHLHAGAAAIPFNIPFTYAPLKGATIPEHEISTRGWRTLHDPLPGTEGSRLSVAKTNSKVFDFTFSVPVQVQDEFSVLLPRFAVNGATLPPLSIRFRKTASLVLMSMNC
jgi:hypothetical protein